MKHKNDKKNDGHEMNSAEPKINDATAEPDKKEAPLSAEEIANLREKAKLADENNDKFLRAMADFDNYRKRAAKDKEDLLKYSNVDFINGFLPIVDNFDRAMESVNQTTDVGKIKDGISLILKQFHKHLEDIGVARIPAVGEVFDPHVHQAVMHVETDGHPENIVVEEMQKGYTLNGRLLRPSMVKVSKEKPPKETHK